MNKLFRTFFIFLLLLSARSGVSAPLEIRDNRHSDNTYSVKQAVSNNIDGLYAIPSSSPIIKQKFDSLTKLYAQADSAQQELSSLLHYIGQQCDAQIVQPPIKSYQRAQQKVASKFAGDASRITDINRASLIAHDIRQLMTVYQTLATQVDIMQVKNRFSAPKDSGYRDLNLLIKLPKTDMIAEIQLHLGEIANIKNGAEHLVYEQVQQIERRAIDQQRQLTEFEQAHITKLRQDSHKQYHKAWLNYKRLDAVSELRASA